MIDYKTDYMIHFWLTGLPSEVTMTEIATAADGRRLAWHSLSAGQILDPKGGDGRRAPSSTKAAARPDGPASTSSLRAGRAALARAFPRHYHDPMQNRAARGRRRQYLPAQGTPGC